MANLIAPVVRRLTPSYTEPGFIVQQAQASGAWELLGSGEPLVRLGEQDRAVYVKRVDMRGTALVTQSAVNNLPSTNVKLGMGGTATYLQRIRQEWDHHDAGMASEWGVGIQDLFKYSTRQAHMQCLRNLLLHGASPQNGEGLLNSAGAVQVTLTADTNSNTGIQSYDPNELFQFFLNNIAQVKTRTMQVGIGRRIVVCAPQRIIAQMTMASVVQLTAWQRAGAGSAAVGGAIAQMLEMNDDEFQLQCDDTLIGAGQGGTDAIIMTIPEIQAPRGRIFNTNAFAELEPGLTATNVQYVNVPAPIEIISPIESGRVDYLTEMRTTSGWGLRAEATTIISAPWANA